jgi:hypothetical protein
MIGYSIFASCIDGTDNGVRIERYMEEEQARGEKYSWKVEDAYIVKE